MLQVHGQPPVSNLSWRYTYVTTNSAENAALSQHIMLAMVANQVTAYEVQTGSSCDRSVAGVLDEPFSQLTPLSGIAVQASQST